MAPGALTEGKDREPLGPGKEYHPVASTSMGGSGPLAALAHLGWAVVIQRALSKRPPLHQVFYWVWGYRGDHTQFMPWGTSQGGKDAYLFNTPGSSPLDTHAHTEENNE